MSGTNAPQSSWSGNSVQETTELSRRIAARQGKRTVCGRLWSHVTYLGPDVPLDECGFPSHSYRYHTLRLQELDIERTIRKIGQDFDDGILDFNQWRVLDRYWIAKIDAISKQIDEEMKAGPQSLEELLQSWGYTDVQAALMIEQNLDTRLENYMRSRRHLSRRNIRGD
ncbi:hypothetical protein DENSPDRAFT_843676 [Dentipellis sp. KUC8613]|nr:hypothetical protein DENSPDRAFT_843676 [Dentipellis sp. KUC8613]